MKWIILLLAFRLNFHLLAYQFLLGLLENVLLMEDCVRKFVFKILIAKKLFYSGGQKLIFKHHIDVGSFGRVLYYQSVYQLP